MTEGVLELPYRGNPQRTPLTRAHVARSGQAATSALANTNLADVPRMRVATPETDGDLCANERRSCGRPAGASRLPRQIVTFTLTGTAHQDAGNDNTRTYGDPCSDEHRSCGWTRVTTPEADSDPYSTHQGTRNNARTDSDLCTNEQRSRRRVIPALTNTTPCERVSQHPR